MKDFIHIGRVRRSLTVRILVAVRVDTKINKMLLESPVVWAGTLGGGSIVRGNALLDR
jgi:hypothetical protein